MGRFEEDFIKLRCHRYGNWREVGFVGQGRVVIEESLIVAWDLLRILDKLGS